MCLVHGQIQFACGAASFSGATLYIRLLDVSNADAASAVVAEQIVPDVRCVAGSTTTLPFALRAPNIDRQAHYTISAHCDLDADGVISVGDLITMQSYPVLTFGFPDHVIIDLRAVR